jgi:diadenosine tetraphosphate (Ap4A) HIT family hydrolase
MGEMGKCALCAEFGRKNRIISKNRHAFSVVARWPIKGGHCLVMPIRHIADVSELTGQEAKAVFGLISALQKALPKLYGKDAIVIQNPAKWRSEGHIHFHVLPSKGAIRHLFEKYENTPFREEAPEGIMEAETLKIRSALEKENSD